MSTLPWLADIETTCQIAALLWRAHVQHDRVAWDACHGRGVLLTTVTRAATTYGTVQPYARWATVAGLASPSHSAKEKHAAVQASVPPASIQAGPDCWRRLLRSLRVPDRVLRVPPKSDLTACAG
jgi:hypothetical protein